MWFFGTIWPHGFADCSCAFMILSPRPTTVAVMHQHRHSIDNFSFIRYNVDCKCKYSMVQFDRTFHWFYGLSEWFDSSSSEQNARNVVLVWSLHDYYYPILNLFSQCMEKKNLCCCEGREVLFNYLPSANIFECCIWWKHASHLHSAKYWIYLFIHNDIYSDIDGWKCVIFFFSFFENSEVPATGHYQSVVQLNVVFPTRK